MNSFRTMLAAVWLFSLPSIPAFAQKPVGLFSRDADIGAVLHPGSAAYDASSQTYRLSGSGSNIWFGHDEFHYVYTRIKGDFILQARGQLVGKGVEQHRKFGWMVRSTLDSSASMISATVHGDGLTALQFRKTPGANIEEIHSSITGADVIQLERRGSKYIMSVAHSGSPFVTTETSDVAIGDEVYVGLFICSHNKDVVEKVDFDNVRVIKPTKVGFIPYKEYIGSNLEILDVATGTRKVIYNSPLSLQAPNWTKDDKSLIYNSNGLLYRFNLKTNEPQVLNTGSVKQNNNDHVLSFDGKMLGLSSAAGTFNSVVYTVPASGGEPKQITPTGPSYTHGWSPDGKSIVFTGQRNGDFDIYRVPATGGEEVRLTTAPGLDDGPEYSPDGQYIYFNSVRSGTMQIWRMKPDGSQQEQLTSDAYNNWFPHISPDGKWVVFITFLIEETKPDDHPFYKHVYLRMIPANGGDPKVLAYVYGGQGTMNTPSWSPDSKKIAFISNTDVNSQ